MGAQLNLRCYSFVRKGNTYVDSCYFMNHQVEDKVSVFILIFKVTYLFIYLLLFKTFEVYTLERGKNHKKTTGIAPWAWSV